MRSIIFTSLLAGAVALPGGAQQFEGECFARDYSAAHLEANAMQTVAALSIRFTPADGGGFDGMAWVSAVMADTPETVRQGVAGQRIDQITLCEPLDRAWNGGPRDAWIKAGVMTCFAECDAGMFQITRSAPDSITIKTNGLVLGEDDGCGGTSMLADVGDSPTGYVTTSYRLDAAPLAACPEF
ncbi:hypothetical protein IV417_15535 [Alphaproteobacteria bacterium KMM 3653]|uniref:Uncharacterized protein n=1 Tax=Harenicola maris TaxID=2841044 RepID=A0AAP2CSN2_9RHOB|nr:hypothetical protein [Harenicola maris]